MTIKQNRFVNPYSFVPLAPVPSKDQRDRSPQLGHAGRNADARYSGHLTLTWTLATPLLLPANAKEEGWLHGREVCIPGSSIAGAVRSLHEAMFNGCFRVVDEEFVPGYRDPADSDPSLTLGLVTAAENGMPTELRLCDDPVWVDSGDLLRRWPAGVAKPTTGDIVRFNGEIEDLEGLKRAEFAELTKVVVVRRGDERAASPDSDIGARVLLVTSTSVRRKRKRNGQPGRALWAAGRLTNQIVRIDPSDEANAGLLRDFRAAAEGTDDRRRLEKDDPDGSWRRETQFEDVEWWADRRGTRMAVMGRRAKASGLLFKGTPVWIRFDKAQQRVTEIKLASIWRKPGRGDVRSRLPEHLRPCIPATDRGLCLSCSTFGAADVSGTEQHRQVSYAGHVRFGAARGTAGGVERVDLAPMGAPRPGNGMFYLERYGERGPRRIEKGEDTVATHWGSWAEGGRQPIAGRKFYWHSDPTSQAGALGKALGRAVPPRYQATSKQKSGKMSRPAQLVSAGTVLTSVVAFDQLDEVGLHALLAALEPQRLLKEVRGHEQGRFATHLGGGKPFGLGSVEVSIDPRESQVSVLAERYRSEGSSAQNPLATPVPYELISQRVGEMTRGLESLAAMLDMTTLGDNAAIMAYPPGAMWDSYQSSDQTRADQFTASHVFFGQANGESIARGIRPWHPLPRPTDPDPTLPIVLKPRGR